MTKRSTKAKQTTPDLVFEPGKFIASNSDMVIVADTFGTPWCININNGTATRVVKK